MPLVPTITRCFAHIVRLVCRRTDGRTTDGKTLAVHARRWLITTLYPCLLPQVNNNGVISFTIPVSAFTPEPFPLGNGLELIAPYWADVDTTGTGIVWYRETSNPDLLNRVQREIVRVFSAQQNFAPINLFIATWDHVGYYSSHADKVKS